MSGETEVLVPVLLPDGVQIKEIIGIKSDFLYALRICGPVRPVAWYSHPTAPCAAAQTLPDPVSSTEPTRRPSCCPPSPAPQARAPGRLA